jgi:hypothetical protein
MAKFLANENVPGEVVDAARQAGHDMTWITELSPGADDMRFTLAVLAQQVQWQGQFSVAQEGKLRVVPLPAAPTAKSSKPKKPKK